MRTTIQIDDSTYDIVRSIAHQNKFGISKTIQMLLLRGLGSKTSGNDGELSTDALTGFPVFASKHSVTEEDVRRLEDET